MIRDNGHVSIKKDSLKKWRQGHSLCIYFKLHWFPFSGKIACGKISVWCKNNLVGRHLVSTRTPSSSRLSMTCLSKGKWKKESFHQENWVRMEEEDFKKVYIVKLPNNFCGIGACVIDHPKKVKSILGNYKTIYYVLLSDTGEKENSHTHEEESGEGGSNNSSELHSKSIPDQRLQVWLQDLCFSHKHQPTAHLSLQRWFSKVCNA